MLAVGVAAQISEHGIIDPVYAGIHRLQQAADADDAIHGGKGGTSPLQTVGDDMSTILCLADNGGEGLQIFQGVRDIF